MAENSVGERRERLVSLHGDDVRLRLDDDRQADADGLRATLTMPRREAWSGITVEKNTRFDGLYLRMAMTLPDFGLVAATKAAVDGGLVAHSWGLGVPTLLDGDSFAYLWGVRTRPPVVTWGFRRLVRIR
ncbi:hypothetical protein FDG2_5072 [Candidatus Protofrankia californiensis]|uniref:Uncharacterized protein n=1 Tax=Candidatus Protofrankia californiensis TaxID=1839754 RepID=A0A1C3PAL8_9ACTN|nr:hypothetical protein FDG2_5072 [Candidatus Protofrankia californiensis]